MNKKIVNRNYPGDTEQKLFSVVKSQRDLLCRIVGLFTTNLSLTVYVTVCTLHRYKLVFQALQR
jgi:hypothetical protein